MSMQTLSFGSDFMDTKHTTEYVRGLRYKLQMMDIDIKRCIYLYGDNQSVLANTTVLDS